MGSAEVEQGPPSGRLRFGKTEPLTQTGQSLLSKHYYYFFWGCSVSVDMWSLPGCCNSISNPCSGWLWGPWFSWQRAGAPSMWGNLHVGAGSQAQAPQVWREPRIGSGEQQGPRERWGQKGLFLCNPEMQGQSLGHSMQMGEMGDPLGTKRTHSGAPWVMSLWVEGHT